ncbi:hypothetical protein HAX54_043661 [Datura stramonium]|uniref:Uncharacterized protein n=1 Tax=Datura stramonium TaxID=4076 RepID=A0ABS8Y7T6_DATST|nr:hypothetical protein [Datura stramonium]
MLQIKPKDSTLFDSVPHFSGVLGTSFFIFPFHRGLPLPLEGIDYFCVDQLLVNNGVTILKRSEIKKVNPIVLRDGSSRFYLITHKYGVRPPHVPNLPKVDHLVNFGSRDRAFISDMTAMVNVICASLILISRVIPKDCNV